MLNLLIKDFKNSIVSSSSKLMSFHPQKDFIIPSETMRVAQAAFPKGNIYMRMRDELGIIYDEKIFVSLFAIQGQPAITPWRLTLICIMQFVEGLTDRQAADAVRSRIDWKYALGLELSDRGFDFSVLSEFRNRLIEGNFEQKLFETMLLRLREVGLLKAPKNQRTDSTHVLANLRQLSRLEIIGETIRSALNSIAAITKSGARSAIAPNWLKQIVPSSDWYKRYEFKIQDNHLPKNKEERNQLAVEMGGDGFYLLDQIYSESTVSWLGQIEAVEILRQVWLQQFYLDPQQNIQLRTQKNCPPPAILINSPYETEARAGNKRTKTWMGYKVHLSETCDEDAPHLITYIETKPATTKDHEVTENVHQSLDLIELLPDNHLADAGYVDAQLLVDSQQKYQLDLVAPVPKNCQWQALAGKGFSSADFDIDWEQQQVQCPQGKYSRTWKEQLNLYQQPVIVVQFKKTDCKNCLFRPDCTKAKNGFRTLTLKPQELHEALINARSRQKTKEFKEKYSARAGIEGTISQGTRAFGLRRCRYRGFPKTRLQHIFIATAINLVRIWQWWTEAYNFGTPASQFARLASD